jgi:hypothetical protein
MKNGALEFSCDSGRRDETLSEQSQALMSVGLKPKSR